MSGGGKKTTVGYRYYMGLHMGLCAGPVDALRQIKVGDRVAWQGNATASGPITIDAPNLFGGEDKEGGIAGTCDVMMGEATQVANTHLAAKQGSPQPAYRGLFGLVFRQGLVSMNNPYVKPWAPLVTRILKGWQSDLPWYSTKASITLAGAPGPAMNPAHIVYECLTNAEWGLGYGSSLIDDGNFRAAADVFHGEGLGLCMLWQRQSTVDAFIQQVVDHAGANLTQDPRTGLFKLKPLRADYTVGSLPVFNEQNVIALEDYQRAAVIDAVNEITVKYRDVITGRDGAVTVHNLANITAQGGVVSQAKEYPGLPTAALALRVAMRDLRVLSTPLARVRLRCTRAAYGTLPGDVIRLQWPKLGLDLVLRVLRVNTGTATAGAVEIDAAEDVFALGATTYAAQPPVGWVDPSNEPAAATARVVTEAPLYELQRSLSSAELGALTGDEGYLWAIAGKPTQDAQGFEIRTRPAGSGAYEQAATGDFAPSGTLAAAIGPAATTATLANVIDGDLIAAGRYAVIGQEVVRVDGFDAGTGVLQMGRGVLDTVARAHALGAPVLFADPYDATDGIERVDGDSIDVKLLPRTGRGQLAESLAPADTVTFDQRPLRPYPPGRMRINGQAYPTELGTQPVITWAHRNRLQQNLEGDESGNIGPEAGVTYSIEVRNANTNTVIASQTGITGTSYTVTPVPDGQFAMRVQLWAVRAGLESRQRHDYTFAYAAPSIATGKTLTTTAALLPGGATNGNGTATGDPTPFDPRWPSARASMRRGAAFAEVPASVLLLLHMDGANGSTTFTDSSVHGHAVTALRNAQITTSDVKYGTGALELPGDGGVGPTERDYLRIGSVGSTPAVFQGLFDGRDFTIEGWAKFDTTDGGPLFAIQTESGGNYTGVDVGFRPFGGGDPRFYVVKAGVETLEFTGATAAPVGAWFHFAIVSSSGGQVRAYVNGVNSASFYVGGNPLPQDWVGINATIGTTANVWVGRGRQQSINGRIDELRITNFARYTDNFTPPAGPYPNP